MLLIVSAIVGCEEEGYDCEPVETQTWLEGCTVDVEYGFKQTSVCGAIAAADDSCPAIDSYEVEQLEAALVAEYEGSSDPEGPEFHGIQCGPVTPQKNTGGECCYWALTGRPDTLCPD